MNASVTYPSDHPHFGHPVAPDDAAIIAWALDGDLQTKLTRLADGDPYMPAARVAGTLWERTAERTVLSDAERGIAPGSEFSHANPRDIPLSEYGRRVEGDDYTPTRYYASIIPARGYGRTVIA